MLPPLIDSHAHLDDPRFADDLDAVLERAAANGITHILSVGGNLESSRANLALADKCPQIYTALGVHPHESSQVTTEILQEIEGLARANDKVVAIGETGLDFYYDNSPRDVQEWAFRQHLQLAQRLDLPVIIHDRDAHEDILRIVREEYAGKKVSGVIHCFSGDRKFARQCIDLGFYLSFAGPLTFPKSEELREVVKSMPVERILVETDCPYLAPQGHRGKRNEPALVRVTAEKVAELKNLSMADISRITNLNVHRLFRFGDIDQSTKIAYRIRDSLYLNITNRCTNACVFCAKFRDFTVKGHSLKLDHEPDAAEVKQAIGDPTRYQEVVFCGYGEPLLRLDLIKEVAAWLKENGVRVRINTDGQANLVHGRDILPELAGLVDAVSVSLNAPDAESYQRICCSAFGPEAYQAVLDFIRQAKKRIPSVTASVVGLPGIDVEECRRIAEELGVDFRLRQYVETH
ncbi:MAG: YchF/TatD family DNA exonuclease [Deltaproteobacteria bacterium]|nr:YchF/TatD family DNA exonuclease [Deltaproteobacteria bacterium]